MKKICSIAATSAVGLALSTSVHAKDERVVYVTLQEVAETAGAIAAHIWLDTLNSAAIVINAVTLRVQLAEIEGFIEKLRCNDNDQVVNAAKESLSDLAINDQAFFQTFYQVLMNKTEGKLLSSEDILDLIKAFGRSQRRNDKNMLKVLLRAGFLQNDGPHSFHNRLYVDNGDELSSMLDDIAKILSDNAERRQLLFAMEELKNERGLSFQNFVKYFKKSSQSSSTQSLLDTGDKAKMYLR